MHKTLDRITHWMNHSLFAFPRLIGNLLCCKRNNDPSISLGSACVIASQKKQEIARRMKKVECEKEKQAPKEE